MSTNLLSPKRRSIHKNSNWPTASSDRHSAWMTSYINEKNNNIYLKKNKWRIEILSIASIIHALFFPVCIMPKFIYHRTICVVWFRLIYSIVHLSIKSIIWTNGDRQNNIVVGVIFVLSCCCCFFYCSIQSTVCAACDLYIFCCRMLYHLTSV